MCKTHPSLLTQKSTFSTNPCTRRTPTFTQDIFSVPGPCGMGPPQSTLSRESSVATGLKHFSCDSDSSCFAVELNSGTGSCSPLRYPTTGNVKVPTGSDPSSVVYKQSAGHVRRRVGDRPSGGDHMKPWGLGPQSIYPCTRAVKLFEMTQ